MIPGEFKIPRNWQDFEDLCLVLFRSRWGDADAQKHGRPGQKQHGVDVFGRKSGRWQGVQCKRRSAFPEKQLSEKEVRNEVENARSFSDPLETLTIATTAPPATSLQKLARALTDAHGPDGPRVVVYGWSELCEMAQDDPNVDAVWRQKLTGEAPRQSHDHLLDSMLHSGQEALPPRWTPGRLLTARYEVVDFEEEARRQELAMLDAWAGSDDPASTWLITGPGGAGKTRLLIEGAARLRKRGWKAGFLNRHLPPNAEEAIFASRTPRFLVVDYAEARTDFLRPLLQQLAEQAPESKVRLVLLARQAGDWWSHLCPEGSQIEDRVFAETALEPLAEKADTRSAIFRRAAEAFAKRMRIEVPNPLPEPNLASDDFSRGLILQMAALAAVRGTSVEGAADALRITLQHERSFWRREAEAISEGKRALLEDLEQAFDKGVTTLTLLGGMPGDASERDVLSYALADLENPKRRAVWRSLCNLYRSTEGSLEALQPDILGQELIIQTLTKEEEESDAKLLDELLDRVDAERAVHTLTVLARIARGHDAAIEWLDRALKGRLDCLASSALDVIVQTGEELVPVLEQRLRAEGTLSLWQALVEQCDQRKYASSVWLSEIAVLATETVFKALSEIPDDSGRLLPERARLSGNLSKRYSMVGQWKLALAAIEEAIRSYRMLAEAQPDGWLPDFALSLNTLGAVHKALGEREQAFKATEEAVDINRKLARAQPNFLPELALSLTNHSSMQRGLGQRSQAARTAEEAVKIYRMLAENFAGGFLPELAVALSNLGNRYGALGRRERALKAIKEAIEIRRSLAEGRPDVFLADLATSLINLGIRHNALGHQEQALEAAEEAVQILHPLAKRRPASFSPDLAKSLNNLGLRYRALGQPERALLVTKEAVRLYENLSHNRPNTFVPNLAASLANLGIVHGDLDQPELALEVTEKAAKIYRTLAKGHPDAFLADLATSLTNLGNAHSALENWEHAFNVTEEAVKIYRTLAEAQPEAVVPSLAMALNNLGISCSHIGQQSRALEATKEAVQLRRTLAKTRPEAFLPDLAMSLSNLGNRYSDNEERELALRTTKEALRLISPLFLRLPSAYATLTAKTLQNYLRETQASENEPDADLVSPVLDALERLRPEV